MSEANKFGIRVSLPADDPLAAEHLLGESWVSERWYESADERDRAYQNMDTQPPYYRQGDTPSVILEKIERQ